MKKQKWIITVVCLLTVVGVAVGSFQNASLQLLRIRRTVEKHHDLLLEDIRTGEFRRSERLPAVSSVRVHPNMVEYACGGFGFGSATSYFGFYYTPDGRMDALWCAGTPLTPYGSGWLYEEKNGDNRYYTEHILDGFYYYEASF